MVKLSLKASGTCLMLLIVLAVMPPIAAGSPITQQIEVEAQKRDRFLEAYPDCRPILIPAEAPGKDIDRVVEKIQSRLLSKGGDEELPFWGRYCLGFALQHLDSSAPNPHWRSVEEDAVKNPGKAWITARLALSQNDTAMFKKYLVYTHKNLLESGYLEAPELASPLMALARRAMKNSNYLLADMLLSEAIRFDPDCPWIPLMRLELLLREGVFIKTNWWQAAGTVADLTVALRGQVNRLLLFFNSLLVLRYALTFFFLFLFLVFLVKHFLKGFHPAAEALPQGMSLKKRYFTLLLLMACLPVLGLNWVICGLIVLLFMWPHLGDWDRKLMLGFMVYLCVLPLLLFIESHLGQIVDSHTIPAQYQNAVNRGWDSENFNILSKLSSRDSAEAALRKAGLSIMLKKKGDYQGAYKKALEALKEAPESPYALNNLGNLNFIYSQYEYARENYRLTFRQSGEIPELLLNLSLAEAFMKNAGQSDVYLKKALSYEWPNISAFVKYNNAYFLEEDTQTHKTPDLRKVMDLSITFRVLKQSMKLSLTSPSFNLFTRQQGPAGISTWIFPASVLLWWGIYLLIRRLPMFRRWLIFSCTLCGRPACRRCSSGNYCGKCETDLRGLQDKVAERRVKTEIRRRVKKRIKWKRVLGNLILPGAGDMALAPAMKPFLTFLITSLLWGLALSIGNLVKIYPDYVLLLLKRLITILLLVFYFYYAVTGLLSVKKRFNMVRN